MKLKSLFTNSTHTSFVQLDTRKCKACWKCQDCCPEEVIGKVDIIIHKHALIINPQRCLGCMKYVKTCPYGAFSKIAK